jgi:hypothetical protein
MASRRHYGLHPGRYHSLRIRNPRPDLRLPSYRKLRFGEHSHQVESKLKSVSVMEGAGVECSRLRTVRRRTIVRKYNSVCLTVHRGGR